MGKEVSPFWSEFKVYKSGTAELLELGKSGQATDKAVCIHCGAKASASLKRCKKHLAGHGGDMAPCMGPSRKSFPQGKDGDNQYNGKVKIWKDVRRRAQVSLNAETEAANEKQRVRISFIVNVLDSFERLIDSEKLIFYAFVSACCLAYRKGLLIKIMVAQNLQQKHPRRPRLPTTSKGTTRACSIRLTGISVWGSIPQVSKCDELCCCQLMSFGVLEG